MPEAVRLGRPLDLPPGKPEQEVYARLRDLAARNVSTEDEISFLGAGMYDHYVPSLIDSILIALGVPDALHALPARDLPGRAAGDVRVPDRDLRADRPAGLQRLASTRARARSPPPPTWRSCTTSARASSSPPACIRTSRETLATTSAGWGTTIEEVPLADGVTDASPRRDRRRRRPPCSCSTRTSSAPSRTSQALTDAAHEAGALMIVAAATR